MERMLAIAAACACWAACRCGQPPPDLDGGAGEDGGEPDASVSDAGRGDGGVDGACDAGFSGMGTQVSSGLDGPRRLASDGTRLYISESGPRPLARGRVLAMPLEGGAAVELAVDLKAPDAITADGLDAFALDGDGLWRVPTDGGAARLVRLVVASNAFGETDLALYGDEVVVATGVTRLLRIKKDGSAQADLYAGPVGSAVRAVAIDQGRAYFLVSGEGLFEVELPSGAPRRVRPDVAAGRDLVLTPTHFLFADGTRVARAPRDGGPIEDLATSLNAPARLWLAGSFLYVADTTPAGRSEQFLRRVSLCDRSVIAVGPAGVGPGDVLYAGALFFSSAESAPEGYVSRLP